MVLPNGVANLFECIADYEHRFFRSVRTLLDWWDSFDLCNIPFISFQAFAFCILIGSPQKNND